MWGYQDFIYRNKGLYFSLTCFIAHWVLSTVVVYLCPVDMFRVQCLQTEFCVVTFPIALPQPHMYARVQKCGRVHLCVHSPTHPPAWPYPTALREAASPELLPRLSPGHTIWHTHRIHFSWAAQPGSGSALQSQALATLGAFASAFSHHD